MRLTVNLDDEVHRLAKAYAAAEDCSLSAAINRLLRRMIETTPAISKQRNERFPISASRVEGIITMEEVRRLDIEDDKS